MNSRGHTSAFPRGVAYNPDTGRVIESNSGMTLRQHFAGLALQGLLANGDFSTETSARMAVEAADFLIAALNNTETPHVQTTG